jgi:HK97 family phage major capsid protein
MGIHGSSDQIIMTTFVKKHWEIDQEMIGCLHPLKDGNGKFLFEPETKEKPMTLLGHPVVITGRKGLRMIFTFADDSKHIVEIEDDVF